MLLLLLLQARELLDGLAKTLPESTGEMAAIAIASS
jgi:hypothetical protein